MSHGFEHNVLCSLAPFFPITIEAKIVRPESRIKELFLESRRFESLR